ncbi:four-carbon acid sugar kinase family protein [Paenibacillus thermotolerans]|uniref:four-carbon acid sugar kinase family protein n=1 Tax=Paenibacillus thermotolerans TaxID=3027807 RepID=UPI0023679EA1|nr:MULTISPECIES: four-carbon acid sugar kinase family protein [unclassified Paenibacillus]
MLDTNSRLDDAATAYRKAAEATMLLREAGATLFINKTCSVFRGNIGAEFDAMLDTLQEHFAVVVLGFPKNGRATVDGIHYVHGKRLEHSEFRSDPVHPMTRSDLAGILQEQTTRRVGLLDYRAVALGPVELRRRIEEMKERCGYLILDVTDQDALHTIARAVGDDFIVCGSSALAEELAQELDLPRSSGQRLQLPKKEGVGILCAAGSLMPQTAAQIGHLRGAGVPVFALDTRRLADAAERSEEIARLTDLAAERMLSGFHAVVHSASEPDIVAETKARGAALGLSPVEVSRLVSEAVAEITAEAMRRTGQNRLIVAGGETSAAVCARMGVRGVRIWKEIEPGLPSSLSLNAAEPLLLVLKSGSFGKADFFSAAIRHLAEQ